MITTTEITSIQTEATAETAEIIVTMNVVDLIEVVTEAAIVITTETETQNILINCRILMISITMRVKEWTQMKKDKIKDFLTIKTEEEVEEEEEMVAIEIMPGMIIRTLKLLEKEWPQTSNMNIPIIGVVVPIIVAVDVEEVETTTTAITETIVIIVIIVITATTVIIVIIKTILEITIEKTILIKSHIMNLRKISSKKK